MKALIVDDAALARALLRKIVGEIGVQEIFEAQTGEESIEIYQAQKPNLVTMDITMPGMDGITAIRKILEVDPSANIVVCSALGQKEVVMDAIQAGAKHFIIKPFENEKVKSTLKAVLGMI